ncbi:MAG: guanylate kinase [Clostridiales bacterium]|nr:guanylate kinase [Clostridiales bacterium]
MGKIFCLMGKSASGKDFVYKNLIAREDLQLQHVVPYTTRPIRSGEVEGLTYFFCSDEEAEAMERAGKVIEMRAYDTVHGVWKYFTADDGQIDLSRQDYLMIGTPESCVKLREYFGADAVCPVYIWVDDGERLARALKRERKQEQPKYAEMCRRFLADERDFSEENLRKAGVNLFPEENPDRSVCSGKPEKPPVRGCFENREKEQILADVAAYIEQFRAAQRLLTE